MLLAKASSKCSEQAYLEREKEAVEKHEFHNGEIFAMAGASKAHCAVVTNISFKLVAFLEKQPCSVFSSDMKVPIEDKRHESKHYVYPDALVTCDQDDIETPGYIVKYPKIIIEVLSPSTEAYDRGEKFELYRQLSSLQDYVLIHQDKKKVEVFSRVKGKSPFWSISTYDESERIVKLPSIGFECDLDALYNKVRLNADLNQSKG